MLPGKADCGGEPLGSQAVVVSHSQFWIEPEVCLAVAYWTWTCGRDSSREEVEAIASNRNTVGLMRPSQPDERSAALEPRCGLEWLRTYLFVVTTMLARSHHSEIIRKRTFTSIRSSGQTPTSSTVTRVLSCGRLPFRWSIGRSGLEDNMADAAEARAPHPRLSTCWLS